MGKQFSIGDWERRAAARKQKNHCYKNNKKQLFSKLRWARKHPFKGKPWGERII